MPHKKHGSKVPWFSLKGEGGLVKRPGTEPLASWEHGWHVHVHDHTCQKLTKEVAVA